MENAIYNPNEKDPMQESLEILQDIATEIANLRESQARNTLSPRLQVATQLLAAWSAELDSLREAEIGIQAALAIADSLLIQNAATREETRHAIQLSQVNAATIAGLVQRVERLEVQQ